MSNSPITLLPNSMVSATPGALTKAPKTKTQTRRPTAAVPAGLFTPKIHHRVTEVTAGVDAYFLEHWPFQDDKARQKFVAAGFSLATCLYFPAAMDERIAFVCRLLALLFLVDGKSLAGLFKGDGLLRYILEYMSLEDGLVYNERLISLSRGTDMPNRSVPVEWITYDSWEEMRVCDKELTDEILEPVATFMRAQTDKSRLDKHELGGYFKYREQDVGKALLSALMRFSMKLQVSPEELQTVEEIEMNCSKHISVVNDIYSWEKEVRASQTGHHEGSALCSSVSVLSSQASLDVAASKRVLWSMCREWEFVHEELVAKRLASQEPCSDSLRVYMKGLEYQMSGNEAWSETTPRYHSV